MGGGGNVLAVGALSFSRLKKGEINEKTLNCDCI